MPITKHIEFECDNCGQCGHVMNVNNLRLAKSIFKNTYPEWSVKGEVVLCSDICKEEYKNKKQELMNG